ncbi:MAG TPA: hypothetical protein VF267_00775, partial [Gammaproteobacteria bacterium]
NHLEPVLDWNRNTRSIEMNIVYRDLDWPVAFDLASTPVFHVLQDGEMQAKIIGWPDDAQGERLKAVLRELKDQD